MSALIGHWRRTFALTDITAWLVSLCLPAYIAFQGYVGLKFAIITPGYVCLLYGWLGPLVVQPSGFGLPLPHEYAPALDIGLGAWAGFAWYANLLWAWNMWRLLRGRSLSISAAVGASLLAATSLQSFHLNFGDDHGVNTASAPVIGAYLWVAAIWGPTLVALVQRYRAIGAARKTSAM